MTGPTVASRQKKKNGFDFSDNSSAIVQRNRSSAIHLLQEPHLPSLELDPPRLSLLKITSSHIKALIPRSRRKVFPPAQSESSRAPRVLEIPRSEDRESEEVCGREDSRRHQHQCCSSLHPGARQKAVEGSRDCCESHRGVHQRRGCSYLAENHALNANFSTSNAVLECEQDWIAFHRTSVTGNPARRDDQSNLEARCKVR